MDDAREVLDAAQEYERSELHRAFRETLSTVAGKRVLFWMLEQCAIYEDAFAGVDAATNYALGRQAAGRKLIAKLDHVDPRLYPKLLIDIAEIREIDRAAVDALTKKENNDDDPEG